MGRGHFIRKKALIAKGVQEALEASGHQVQQQEVVVERRDPMAESNGKVDDTPESKNGEQEEVVVERRDPVDDMDGVEYYDSSQPFIEESPEKTTATDNDMDVELIDLDSSSDDNTENDNHNELSDLEPDAVENNHEKNDNHHELSYLEPDSPDAVENNKEKNDNDKELSNLEPDSPDAVENNKEKNDNHNDSEGEASGPFPTFEEFRKKIMEPCQERGITPEQFLKSWALWEEKREKKKIKKMQKDVDYIIKSEKEMVETEKKEFYEMNSQFPQLKSEISKLEYILGKFQEKKEALILDKFSNNMLIRSEVAREEQIERENRAKELSKPQLREILASNREKIKSKEGELYVLEEKITNMDEKNKELRKERNSLRKLIVKTREKLSKLCSKNEPKMANNNNVEQEPIENDGYESEETLGVEEEEAEETGNIVDSDLDDETVIIRSSNSKIPMEEQLELSDEESTCEYDIGDTNEDFGSDVATVGSIRESDVGDTNEDFGSDVATVGSIRGDNDNGYTSQETLSDSSDSDTEVESRQDKKNNSLQENDSDERRKMVTADNSKSSFGAVTEETLGLARNKLKEKAVKNNPRENIMNDPEISLTSPSSISKTIFIGRSTRYSNRNTGGDPKDVIVPRQQVITAESPENFRGVKILTRFSGVKKAVTTKKKTTLNIKITQPVQSTSKSSVKTKNTNKQRTTMKKSNDKKKPGSSLTLRQRGKDNPKKKLKKNTKKSTPSVPSKKTKVTTKRTSIREKKENSKSNKVSTSTKKTKTVKPKSLVSTKNKKKR